RLPYPTLVRAEGDGTLLGYSAKAQGGGKLAQVGSRLIDAAASKIAEDFFAAFEARLAAPAQEASPGAQEASPDEAQETGPGQARQPVSPTHRKPDAQDTGTIPGAAEAASDLGVESGTGIRDLSRPGRAVRPPERRRARGRRPLGRGRWWPAARPREPGGRGRPPDPPGPRQTGMPVRVGRC